MRLRVRLKSLALVGVVSTCCLLYTLVSVHRGAGTSRVARHGGRVARVTAKDLLLVGHYTGTETQDRRATETIPDPAHEITHSIFNVSASGSAPCDSACQIKHTKQKQMKTEQKQMDNVKQISAKGEEGSRVTLSPAKSKGPCDCTCRKKKLIEQGVIRGKGYASRVQVENMTLPESWTVTRELMDRLALRVQHVKETCRKYGLNKLSPTNQPNAWEFFINERHNLVWCNIFKAASSTWIYNFNLLAGYSETELMSAKEAPINLARKRYARPTVQQLQATLNGTHSPLSFMIARHPLKRLVSAYRDKILSGNRYYSKLSRTILKKYPEMGKGVGSSGRNFGTNFGVGKSLGQSRIGQAKQIIPRLNPHATATVPSFPQFVQYVLDEYRKGARLDEHWTSMNDFCTPCLVPFDVFAKVETLEEDGNYIIFSAEIDDVIRPKRINRSRDRPTEEVADKFLCQLKRQQMDGLLHLYKYDVEMFEYEVDKYKECTQKNT